MFAKQIGNILIGKSSLGENIRVVKNDKKTITEVGNTIREKIFKSVPIEDEKEIFKTAFPQYNDFQLFLRHDKYSGNKFGTNDYGKLIGINQDGEKVVLMRQNKVNSAYSDITLNYDTNVNVPLKPNEFEAFQCEVKLYRPTDFQIRPTEYTEVTSPFARAYLNGDGTLKIKEKATDEFFKIMRRETSNIR